MSISYSRGAGIAAAKKSDWLVSDQSVLDGRNNRSDVAILQGFELTGVLLIEDGMVPDARLWRGLIRETFSLLDDSTG